MKVDLELASTNALIEELFKRFDTVVFAGCQLRTDDEQQMHRHWQGNHIACVGLAEFIKVKVIDELEDALEPADELETDSEADDGTPENA